MRKTISFLGKLAKMDLTRLDIFTDDAIREIIRSYTREAGVRQLERELGAICRGVATRVAEGFKEKNYYR